jgi:hypothetical protein
MYKWIWKDDDAIYENNADDPKEIVEEILDYYFEDSGIDYSLQKDQEGFNVYLKSNGGSTKLSSGNDLEDICFMLAEMAKYDGRKDQFLIFKK